MAYTVHEVAKLSGTTIKTLYHYQKIGLLIPEEIAENGYRFYGEKELERLQQILFYRELDFSLKQIKTALEDVPNRLNCLCEQQSMLKARQQRLHRIMQTLDETISLTKKGEVMSSGNMFKGLNQQEWLEGLSEQKDYLQRTYNYELDTKQVNASEMNEAASEAVDFMSFMANALETGIRADDGKVVEAIEKHIQFLQRIHPIDRKGFAAQAKFFLTDDFHRNMLENQKIGLSYYICIAAEYYAAG